MHVVSVRLEALMSTTYTPEFTGSPDVMPVLSPGKHRNPRQGACFMEFASYLAGERWSDHPPCTHPLLAFLARGVNDFSSDEARGRLVPLIPSVIGLNGSDPRIDLMIALRSAACAIPVASESRQRALATGLLSCEQMLGELGMADDTAVVRRIADSLALAPRAREWAEDFEALRGKHRRSLSFTRAGRAIVSTAVLGIAQACIDDADGRLYELLSLAIDDSALLVQPSTAAPSAPSPAPIPDAVRRKEAVSS
jgi:hypothetical protein